MKKLLLSLVGFVFAMIGCDPTTSLQYEIKNETQSEIIVKIGDHKPVSILPGDKRMVYSDGMLGGSDPLSDIITAGLKVVINDKQMSEYFWQKEYWNVNRKGKHNYTCLLILTNDLMDTLSSEDLQ